MRRLTLRSSSSSSVPLPWALPSIIMFRPAFAKFSAKPFQGAFRSSFFRPTTLKSTFAVAPVAKRFATHNSYPRTVTAPTSKATNWPKVLTTVGIVGGTIVGLEFFLNRQTREGGIPLVEREYLNQTFKYVGGGLAITAFAARGLFTSGYMVRFMSLNPWVALIGGLGLSIGSMMGVFYTDPANSFQKHAFWLAFQGSQALFLAPTFFFAPAIIGRAALYTVGLVGGLSYVSATAKTDQYLYLGGPLLGGLLVVVLSSLAPMVLPVTAVRSLALTEMVSVYGGLAIFGGFVLYDTQKVMHHARMGVRDPAAESIGLELDIINIFWRLLFILGGSNRRK